MKEKIIHTPEGDVLKDFFISRHNAAHFADTVERIAIVSPQKEFPWEDYNRTIYMYDKNFKDIQGQKPLISYINEGRKFVLDVMGPGFALRSIRSKLEGGVSVTLACPHSISDKKKDLTYGLKIVAEHPRYVKVAEEWKHRLGYGDVLQGSTWREVTNFTKGRPFGLIVCAGEGSWKTFEKDEGSLPENTLHLPQKEIYWVVANKMWKMLSREKGIMCILFSPNYDWKPWINELQKAGIDVSHDGKQGFRFTKYEYSLKTLPRMSESMSPRIFKTKI